MSGRYWTVRQLAEAAGVSVQRVRQWLARGSVRGHKVGRDWMITHAEAERVLRQRQP